MPRLVNTVARCTLSVVTSCHTCHTVVSCLFSCQLPFATTNTTVCSHGSPSTGSVSQPRGKAKGFSSICKGNSCWLAARISTTMQCTQGQFSLQAALSLSRSLSHSLCLGVVSLRYRGWIWFVGGDLFSFCRFVYVFRSFFHLQPAFFLALSLFAIIWFAGQEVPLPSPPPFPDSTKWKGLFVLSRNMNPYQSKSFGKCGKICTIY